MSNNALFGLIAPFIILLAIVFILVYPFILDKLFSLVREKSRIQMFTSDGTFLGQWGSNGSGEGEFTTPLEIAVDRSGTIYVADTNNNRIQTFKRSDVLPASSGSSPLSTSSSGSPIPVIGGIILSALSVRIILPSRWK